MAKVYVSSTFLDLQVERRAVIDWLIQARHQPIHSYLPDSESVRDSCLADVDDCDIYVLILGHRYGFVPEADNPERLSITQLEFRRAAGKPRLALERTSVPDLALSDLLDPEKNLLVQGFHKEVNQTLRAAQFKDEAALIAALSAGMAQVPKSSPGDRQFASPPFTNHLDRYRAAALSLHASLPLAGFKTKLRVPIDLAELYVPLNAVVDLRGGGDCGFADASDAAEKLREHGSRDIPLIDAFREAALRKRRGLMILGDPGSGKTTHLKRLLLACLREGPGAMGLPDDLLPVFLPLRDLDDLTQGVDAFIEKALADPHLALPVGFGRELLDRGRLLLLFDGLDEVSDPTHRAEVARWIGKAATYRSTCTVVVTCRFAGYADEARLGAGFLELHLRPLTREQSEAFITNWYRVVETGLAADPAQGALTAEQRAGDLIERLRAPEYRSARMAEMTRNPLLLTNLCLVHRDRGVLPSGRHQLYEECIEVLLERWREAKNLRVAIPAAVGKRVLQPAALWLHGEDGRTRASADELAPVIAPALEASLWRGGDAADFLRAVRDDSGLLTGWSSNQFGFMHLGFQEYLAACEIRRLAFEGDKDAVLRELAGHYGESWWQEVILLLLAQGNPSLFEPFMRLVLENPEFDPSDGLLAMILEESAETSLVPFLDVLRAEPGSDPQRWAHQYQAFQVLEPRLSDTALTDLAGRLCQHPSRELRAWAIGRTAVATLNTRFSLRGEVELVKIPAGTFLMGSPKSDRDADERERPQHKVEIGSFWLGRYPVTNEEYGRFLADSPDAKEPKYWGDRRFNQARQPVVGVSWDDAVRFAEWAGGRLPTEAEWEYAARAGTTTRYWWGGEFERNRANCFGSSTAGAGLQTSPVGSFQPNAFGLYDTAGNVWEWVQDRWHKNYRGAPADGSAWESGDEGARVLRGGSWSYKPNRVRSASRYWLYPDDRTDILGFRLARTLA